MGMAVQAERARRRFTVEEYDRMVEAGILGPDERIELIYGEILEMSPIEDPHAGAVGNLNELLVLGARQRARVWCQLPVRVHRHSKPQPDLALLRRRSYIKRGTGPSHEDMLLAVEVADTTLRYDRTVKQRLYAEGGVPEYWIVDVSAEAIEVYREPGAGGYRQVQVVPLHGTLAPLAFPDLVIAVADVFA
jgi:Uma2 family endonuclease